ncbi:C6 zinc finger domain protein [Fusarium sp. NRRL 52700]|nr:C6 zinc finger domain protein [Fusarium sp. NRRL 52700]
MRSGLVRFATGNRYQKAIDAQDPSPSPPSTTSPPLPPLPLLPSHQQPMAELGVSNVMRPFLPTPSAIFSLELLAATCNTENQRRSDGLFSRDSLAVCLRERGSAIRLLREDLRNSGAISSVSVLTVFLLGMSASWIKPRPDSWGKERMDGARALMKLILVDKKARQDSTTQLLAGWYLWWDMTCAFLVNTCESPDGCIS